MPTKNNLKDRIKKPNATAAFFNSYDNNNDDTRKVNNNENDNKDNIVVQNNTINENNIKEEIVIDDNNVNDNNDKTNIKDNNNDKTYVNNDNVVNVNNDYDDYFRELASGKKPTKKKSKKVFTSFYMDPDLSVEVDKITSRGEKGDKSKLINMGIRKLLEEYGVIEKK